MTREQKLERFAALIADTEGVELKGKGTPYTSLHGNMFAFLGKQDELTGTTSATLPLRAPPTET